LSTLRLILYLIFSIGDEYSYLSFSSLHRVSVMPFTTINVNSYGIGTGILLNVIDNTSTQYYLCFLLGFKNVFKFTGAKMNVIMLYCKSVKSKSYGFACEELAPCDFICIFSVKNKRNDGLQMS